MYVHMYNRGPRGGARSADYFDDLTEASVDLVDDDGGVLRIRTAGGQIDLAMSAEELGALAQAFAKRPNKRRGRKRIVPSASPHALSQASAPGTACQTPTILA